MKKILILLALFVSIGTMAQKKDTIQSIVINVNDSLVNCYHLDFNDTTQYATTLIDKDSLQPQLNNYIAIVNRDYCKNDTLNWVQYQQFSGEERFLIDTKKRRFVVELSELSPALQESIYLFSLKLKAIIKDEN